MVDTNKKTNTLEQLELLATRTKKENEALSAKIAEINGKGYQTEAQVTAAINAKLTSTYKAAGTLAASGLTDDLLDEAHEGFVYNVTEEFTTNDKFKDPTSKTLPAGTNVAVVKDGDSGYKFDAMAGVYSHPTHEQHASGLYKVTVDDLGHVTAAEQVQKEDITGLGIPGSDTTYEAATTETPGLMSASDKEKLDGIVFATNEEVNTMLDKVFGSEAAD